MPQKEQARTGGKEGRRAGAVTVSPRARAVIGRFARPVRGKIVLGAVLAAASSFFTFVPYLAITLIAQEAVEHGVPDMAWLAPMLAAAILSALLGRLLHGLGTVICHYADADFRVGVRGALAEHLSRLPLGWFAGTSSGEVKQAANDDVQGMHQVVAHAPADVAAAVLTPLIPLVYLFMLNWGISLGMLLYVAVSLSLSMYVMTKDFARLNDEYNAANVALSAAAVEMADGIEIEKTYGSSTHASPRFHDAVDRLTDATYNWTARTAGSYSAMTALFSPATVVALLALVSALLVNAGQMTVSTCLPFLILGAGIPNALVRLTGEVSFLRQAGMSAEHLGSVLDVQPLPEAARPTPLPASQLDVSFEGVSFAYDGQTRDALQDVNLVMRPGTVTALVGESGSGKTTLARLIPRFWDPTAGTVRIGGVDVRDAALDDVLSKTAIVLQDSMLLRESIRDNIRLAKPDAPDDQVEAAARAAQVHDRILELPRGYDTVVGSSDGNLSGGEAQRVAIARAIMQDAPILVLDEATAHADPENETAIQDALAHLARGRTAIVIAHRLNTIVHADNIVVLDGGRVVEQGTHGQLLEAGGRYAQLWRKQQVDDGFPKAAEPGGRPQGDLDGTAGSEGGTR